MNRNLLIIIILLIPLTIISFLKKETNFSLKEEEEPQKIYVPVREGDQINNIELEDYVIGVVAGEMPALFEIEALKSQAIAARTYAINHLKSQKSITNTTSDQVYITKEEMLEKWQDKYDTYYNKISNAVLSTKDLIMFYNNEPIKAYYYSMSNGYTESSLNVFKEENAYLNIIPSPYDGDNSNTITISQQEFCTNLNIQCSFIEITNIIKDKSNRISKITINNKDFTGIEVRKKLSLRSTDFQIIKKNNYLEITTRGYGHGVGMSQHGSNNMAKLGYNYEEILKYYYQNIKIDKL
ncbi:MAG TPA: stage II sporulation protein D [Firmicutes bacterium]|nr:stage II sporulation protein D [Bacillota bacterium]